MRRMRITKGKYEHLGDLFRAWIDCSYTEILLFSPRLAAFGHSNRAPRIIFRQCLISAQIWMCFNMPDGSPNQPILPKKLTRTTFFFSLCSIGSPYRQVARDRYSSREALCNLNRFHVEPILWAIFQVANILVTTITSRISVGQQLLRAEGLYSCLFSISAEFEKQTRIKWVKFRLVLWTPTSNNLGCRPDLNAIFFAEDSDFFKHIYSLCSSTQECVSPIKTVSGPQNWGRLSEDLLRCSALSLFIIISRPI